MDCMPPTWRKVTYLAVGGLTEVGFADGPLLLVVSHQGRAVVDLASGELLARDQHEIGVWFDAARRAVLGIGPLDGAWIGVCGLAGGRLPDATADGWQARVSGACVTISAPRPAIAAGQRERGGARLRFLAGRSHVRHRHLARPRDLPPLERKALTRLLMSNGGFS
jgi:hypothetical protein